MFVAQAAVCPCCVSKKRVVAAARVQHRLAWRRPGASSQVGRQAGGQAGMEAIPICAETLIGRLQRSLGGSILHMVFAHPGRDGGRAGQLV